MGNSFSGAANIQILQKVFYWTFALFYMNYDIFVQLDFGG